MDSTERTAFRNLRRGLVIFLLALKIPGIAADDAVPYTLVVDPPAAEVGETVQVSFVISGIAPADVSVSAPPLPRDLEVIRGPYIRPLLPGKGTVVEYALRPASAGVYSIAGFVLEAEGRRTTTSGFRIRVTGPERRGGAGTGDAADRPSFRWTAASLRIEAGRSSPVFLVADREVSDGEILRLRYQKPERGIVTDLPMPDDLLSAAGSGTREGGEFGFAAAGFLYTPLEAGTTVIPGGTVSLSEGDVEFDPLELEVVPLLADVGMSGGVGDFRLDAELSMEGYEVSGSAVLTVRITGTGNLPVLRLPRADCTGGRCYETGKRGDFEPTLRGYTGWIEKTYRVEALPNQSPRIVLADFSRYDPWEDRIKTSPGGTWRLPEYMPAEERTAEDAVPPPGDTRLPESLTPGDLKITGNRFPYEEPLAGVVFLPGAAALTAGLVMTRARRRVRKKPRPGGLGIALPVILAALSAGAVIGLISWASAVPEGGPRNGPVHSGVLLDEVLLAEAGNNRADAVVLLKRALRVDPGDPRIRDVADWYEKTAEIGLMHPGVPFSRPDILYPAVAILLAVTGLILGTGRPGGARISGVCTAAAAVMFAVSLLVLSRPDAVAGRNASLKRIPEDESGVIREIAEGTVLETSARTGIYTLVQTETGEEGWIESKHLVEL
ncbi:MAG: BatD family protein [Spirochaetia bacterium]